jgi:hypothetical protein
MTKLGWFEDDAYRALADDARGFLEKGTTVGLQAGAAGSLPHLLFPTAAGIWAAGIWVAPGISQFAGMTLLRCRRQLYHSH